MQTPFQPPEACTGNFGCVVVRPNHTVLYLAAPDLPSLAREVAFWTAHNRITYNPCQVPHAWAPSGKPLDVLALATYGWRLRIRRERTANRPSFRQGAIPGTGRRKAYLCFRHPKTQAERKANALVLPTEGELPIRGTRRPKQLPHAWDDNWRERSRCWKRFRRQQYKA